MIGLERLQAIWAKYALFREADAAAGRVRAEAWNKLKALNDERRGAGLPEVSVSQSMNIDALIQQGPLSRTWRDDQDAELLAAVKAMLGGGS